MKDISKAYSKGNKIWAGVFAVLTFLLLCFIWGQSMLPREASAAESSRWMLVLKPLLDPGNQISDDTFHHYLRKAAHFSEYAALGFCMSGFLMNLQWKRTRARIPTIVACCVLTAAIDESIQLFSEGRGAQISDVLLDACGALFGLAVFLLLFFALRRKKLPNATS